MFANRKQAGKLLCRKVQETLVANGMPPTANNIVVAALPRGGVPVGLELARHFRCRVDLLAAKKIPMPDQPEFAIGATSSDGITVLNTDIPKTEPWNQYVQRQVKSLETKTKQIESDLYHKAGYAASNFRNKVVLLVDDGIATGMTAFAAVLTARERGAAYIVMAAPVMSSQSYADLKAMCDAVIPLAVPQDFQAVGHFYEEFEQVSMDEVIRDMRESRLFIQPAQPRTLQSSQLAPGQMIDEYI